MFGLTSKQRNPTKMVCYSELTSSPMSAEIKPILILVKEETFAKTIADLGQICWTFNKKNLQENGISGFLPKENFGNFAPKNKKIFILSEIGNYCFKKVYFGKSPKRKRILSA